MRRVIFNQKGGVGKSSISCNLAAVSAFHGLKTLVVDLDVQGNSTRYLMGSRHERLQNTVADLFEQSMSFNIFTKRTEDFVHATPFPNLMVLPSSPELDFIERKLESKHKIYKLRDALDQLGTTFDRIYIDTAPSLNFYSRSALIASQGCVIPFDCDDFSRQGIYSILGEIHELQADHNPNLRIEGIVVNQFQNRASLPAKIIDELESEGLPVLPVKIPASIKMKESHQQHKPLIQYLPKHPLTLQFVELWNYLEGRRAGAAQSTAETVSES